MHRYILFLVFLVISLLGACQSVPLVPSSSTPDTPFASPVASPDMGVFDSPISVTATAVPSAGVAVISTPADRTKSTVTGILMLNPASPIPVGDAILYLASIRLSDTGTPLVAALDKQTAPHTQTDPTGRFVFVDVPPQRYALILDRMYEAFLLSNPEDQTDMLIEPEPGQVLDLGVLVYPSLPGLNPQP